MATMYTVAFDETTNFETLKSEKQINHQNDEPIMLAGVVFHDTSKNKYKINREVVEPERERIIRYYQAVCDTVGSLFPEDLHVNSNDYKSREYVKRTKEEVRKTLGEFIKFGTYKGKELLFSDGRGNIVKNNGVALKRAGFYQLVVLLKEPGSANQESVNLITRDDIASNLYSNMLQEYLKKAIFFNLSIEEDIPTVAFNIPTRKLEKKDVSSTADYSKTGYGTHISSRNNKKYFTISDSGYIRSLITELSDDRNIEIEDLFTKSIVYTCSDKMIQERRQAFLFLSDSLCGVLSFKNKKPFDQDIRKRMESLNDPQQNLFFYYDGRDDYYDKAVKAFLKKEMLTALSEIYNGRHQSSPEVIKYYNEKWFPLLEEKVLESMTPGLLMNAVKELDGYRYSDNLEQSKFLYLIKMVEKAAESISIDNRYKFMIADIAVSAYTHVGNPKMAEHYFYECMKYQDDINFDEVQKSQIRYITTLNDLLAFERARDYALSILGIDISSQTVETNNNTNHIKNDIEEILSNGTDEEINNSESSGLDKKQIVSLLPKKVSRPNMYKALSSLGQTYAFMKDSLAEYCFKKSINDIQYSSDSSITMSFLLHWYIDNGDEPNYRKNAQEYFDGKSGLKRQLTYLINEGSKKREESPRFSLGYAMFVFIKAFYVFYKDDPQNRKIRTKLIHINKTVSNAIDHGENYMKDHPWELIYKYAAMLAYNTDEKTSSEIRSENMRYASEAIGEQPENIIRKIIDFGEIEFLAQDLTNDSNIQEYHNKINTLWDELYADNVFSHRDSADISENEKLDDLKNVFTYMYH